MFVWRLGRSKNGIKAGDWGRQLVWSLKRGEKGRNHDIQRVWAGPGRGFWCCPCWRRQVGKQVEEMWWTDRIVYGRWEEGYRSDFCSVLMLSSRCSILVVSLRVSVAPAILPSSTFVLETQGMWQFVLSRKVWRTLCCELRISEILSW
jgi:hypothetical protein